ncbi:hypothetical protein RB595_009087 [Gaeumannomyces hyphopodioides]
MCSSWWCMTQAAQFGIVFSTVFTALTIIFLYWYLVWKQRQPPASSEDVEVIEIELPRPGLAEEGARRQCKKHERQDTAASTHNSFFFFFTRPQIVQPPKPRGQIEYRLVREDEPEDRQAHSEEGIESQQSPPPSRRSKPKKPKKPKISLPQPPTPTLLPPYVYQACLPENNLASPGTSASPHQQRPAWTNYYWRSPPLTWQQQQQQWQQQQQAQPSHVAQTYHHMGPSQPSQPQMVYWYPVVQQPANLHAPRDMPAPVQVPPARQAFPQSMQQPVQFAQPTQFTQTAQFAQKLQPTNISQHSQPTQFTQHVGFAQRNLHRESRAAQRHHDFMGQQQASGIHATAVSPAMSRDTRTSSVHIDQHEDEPLTRGASWWRRLIWRLPVTGRASTLDGSSTSRSQSTGRSPSRSPSPAPRRSRGRSGPRQTRHRDSRRQRDGSAANERNQGSLSSRSRSPSRVRARPAVASSGKHQRRYSESIESDVAVQPQRGHSHDRARERRSLTPDFPDLFSLPSHTTLDGGEPPLSPSIGHDTNPDRMDLHYPEKSESLFPDLGTQFHTQVTEPQESLEIPQISVTPPGADVAQDHMCRRRPDGADRRVSFDEDPVSQSHIIEQISETTESVPGTSGQSKLSDTAPRTSAHLEVSPVEPRVLYVETPPSELSEAGLTSGPSKSEAGSSSVIAAKEDAGIAWANASPESGEDKISQRSNQTQRRDRQTSSHRSSIACRRGSDADSSGSGESYMPSPPKPFATQTFSGRASITGRRFGRDSKVSVADSMEVQLSPDETVFPGHKIPPARRSRRSEARRSSSTTFYRFQKRDQR